MTTQVDKRMPSQKILASVRDMRAPKNNKSFGSVKLDRLRNFKRDANIPNISTETDNLSISKVFNGFLNRDSGINRQKKLILAG